MPRRLIQRVCKVEQKLSFVNTLQIFEVSSRVRTICLDLAAHKKRSQNSRTIQIFKRLAKMRNPEIPEIH